MIWSCNTFSMIVVRFMYERLQMYGVPVPNNAIVWREYPGQELDYYVEQDDFVEIHEKRFCKPFVEKPIDGHCLGRPALCYAILTPNKRTLNLGIPTSYLSRDNLSHSSNKYEP